MRSICCDNIYGSKFETFMDLKMFLKLYNRMIDDNLAVKAGIEKQDTIKINIEDFEMQVGNSYTFDMIWQQIQGAIN